MGNDGLSASGPSLVRARGSRDQVGDYQPAVPWSARVARASLWVLTVFSIGRVQELFAFLAPLRIVFAVGSVCVGSALLTTAASRQPVLRQREVRILLALAGLAVTFSPLGVWPGGSLTFLLESYGKVIALCILIIALATEPRVVRNLVWAVLLSVGLLGLFTLSHPSIKTSLEYAVGRAYASTTYDPNDVAMIMACTLPLAALGAATLRGVRRLGAVSVAAICVLSIIRTVSRGGFIGLGIVSLLLLRRLRSVGTRLIVGTAIVAVLAVATPAAYWGVMDTIWSPTGTGYTERGISTRLEVWQRGLNLLLRNPLTGVGIGAYEAASWLTFGRYGWTTAHNSFLQVATELGIIGLGLFVALLWVAIGNARRALRAAQQDPRLQELEWIAAAVEISLYAYLVVGFALSQAYAAMVYFLVGVTTALRLQVERCRDVPRTDVIPAGPVERLRASLAARD